MSSCDVKVVIENAVREAYAAFAAMVVESRSVPAIDPKTSSIETYFNTNLPSAVPKTPGQESPRDAEKPFNIKTSLCISTHYFRPMNAHRSEKESDTINHKRDSGTLGAVLERWEIQYNDGATGVSSPSCETFRRDVAILLRVIMVKLRLLPLYRLVTAMRRNTSCGAALGITCESEESVNGPFLGMEYKLAPIASVRSHYGVLSAHVLYRDDIAPLLSEVALNLSPGVIIQDYSPTANGDSQTPTNMSSGIPSPFGTKPISIPGANSGPSPNSAQSLQSPVFGGGSIQRSLPVAVTMPKPPLVSGSFHSLQPHLGPIYVVGRRDQKQQSSAQAPLPPLQFGMPPANTVAQQPPEAPEGDEDEQKEEEKSEMKGSRFMCSSPIENVPLLSLYTPFGGAQAAAVDKTPIMDDEVCEGIFSAGDSPKLQEITDDFAQEMDAGDYLKYITQAGSLRAFQSNERVASAQFKQSIASDKESVSELVHKIYSLAGVSFPTPPLTPVPMPKLS